MNEINEMNETNEMYEIKHTKKEWDLHMLKIAKLYSEMSKDPSTKVGAVITDNLNKVISLGYNGFPPEIPDYLDWYNNRDIKYKLIIHAEKNALINKGSKSIPNGSTIYVYPLKPCKDCYILLKNEGISRFVSVKHNKDDNTQICNVCKKDQCSNDRWDQTSYYTDQDEVILYNYSELV